MNKVVRFMWAAAVVLSACNLPAAAGPSPEISTIAALTVQAAIEQTPAASPAGDNSQGTATAGGSKALIDVEDVTNCRSGPGVNYEKVIQIVPGQPVEVVGSFPPGYWVVSTGGGTCWVSAEFATPVGNLEAVPTVTAPPTPEGQAPAAPTFPKQGWTYYCFGSGEMEVTFTWKDNADNETGYRILRNGTVIIELPANSTTYYDRIVLLSGQSVSYQIEAYNLIGSSRSTVVTLDC